MNNLDIQSSLNPVQDDSVQYVANEDGQVTGVIVPIDVWNDLMSELETHHLLKSDRMRQRLLDALGRDEGLNLEDALQQLGFSDD